MYMLWLTYEVRKTCLTKDFVQFIVINDQRYITADRSKTARPYCVVQL